MMDLNIPPKHTLHIHLVMCRCDLLTTKLQSENESKILKEKEGVEILNLNIYI